MRTWSGRRRFILCFFLLLVIFHIFSVLELYSNSVTEALQKNRNKKSYHLVLGPAASQGLPNRLQCEGSKALNKTHLLDSSSDSNVRDNVAFVTVFTIYNTSLDSFPDDRSSNLVIVGNVFYTYWACLLDDPSVSSIQHVKWWIYAKGHLWFKLKDADKGKQQSIRRSVNVLIYLDVKKALEDGMKLYVSDNRVILTEGFDGILCL
ncbi:conserved hypothetical protein [Ricinus communis]|uniref:Uncharacterized protein n=1 Tax=Ricinus communis TaxID=3988 RepID=B9S8U5_RICCO|nr:conserved hypothetical protein [Ricinus communis]